MVRKSSEGQLVVPNMASSVGKTKVDILADFGKLESSRVRADLLEKLEKEFSRNASPKKNGGPSSPSPKAKSTKDGVTTAAADSKKSSADEKKKISSGGSPKTSPGKNNKKLKDPNKWEDDSADWWKTDKNSWGGEEWSAQAWDNWDKNFDSKWDENWGADAAEADEEGAGADSSSKKKNGEEEDDEEEEEEEEEEWDAEEWENAGDWDDEEEDDDDDDEDGSDEDEEDKKAALKSKGKDKKKGTKTPQKSIFDVTDNSIFAPPNRESGENIKGKSIFDGGSLFDKKENSDGKKDNKPKSIFDGGSIFDAKKPADKKNSGGKTSANSMFSGGSIFDKNTGPLFGRNSGASSSSSISTSSSDEESSSEDAPKKSAASPKKSPQLTNLNKSKLKNQQDKKIGTANNKSSPVLTAKKDVEGRPSQESGPDRPSDSSIKITVKKPAESSVSKDEKSRQSAEKKKDGPFSASDKNAPGPFSAKAPGPFSAKDKDTPGPFSAKDAPGPFSLSASNDAKAKSHGTAFGGAVSCANMGSVFGGGRSMFGASQMSSIKIPDPIFFANTVETAPSPAKENSSATKVEGFGAKIPDAGGLGFGFGAKIADNTAGDSAVQQETKKKIAHLIDTHMKRNPEFFHCEPCSTLPKSSEKRYSNGKGGAAHEFIDVAQYLFLQKRARTEFLGFSPKVADNMLQALQQAWRDLENAIAESSLSKTNNSAAAGAGALLISKLLTTAEDKQYSKILQKGMATSASGILTIASSPTNSQSGIQALTSPGQAAKKISKKSLRYVNWVANLLVPKSIFYSEEQVYLQQTSQTPSVGDEAFQELYRVAENAQHVQEKTRKVVLKLSLLLVMYNRQQDHASGGGLSPQRLPKDKLMIPKNKYHQDLGDIRHTAFAYLPFLCSFFPEPDILTVCSYIYKNLLPGYGLLSSVAEAADARVGMQLLIGHFGSDKLLNNFGDLSCLEEGRNSTTSDKSKTSKSSHKSSSHASQRSSAAEGTRAGNSQSRKSFRFASFPSSRLSAQKAAQVAEILQLVCACKKLSTGTLSSMQNPEAFISKIFSGLGARFFPLAGLFGFWNRFLHYGSRFLFQFLVAWVEFLAQDGRLFAIDQEAKNLDLSESERTALFTALLKNDQEQMSQVSAAFSIAKTPVAGTTSTINRSPPFTGPTKKENNDRDTRTTTMRPHSGSGEGEESFSMTELAAIPYETLFQRAEKIDIDLLTQEILGIGSLNRARELERSRLEDEKIEHELRLKEEATRKEMEDIRIHLSDFSDGAESLRSSSASSSASSSSAEDEPRQDPHSGDEEEPLSRGPFGQASSTSNSKSGGGVLSTSQNNIVLGAVYDTSKPPAAPRGSSPPAGSRGFLSVENSVNIEKKLSSSGYTDSGTPPSPIPGSGTPPTPSSGLPSIALKPIVGGADSAEDEKTKPRQLSSSPPGSPSRLALSFRHQPPAGAAPSAQDVAEFVFIPPGHKRGEPEEHGSRATGGGSEAGNKSYSDTRSTAESPGKKDSSPFKSTGTPFQFQ